MKRIHDAFVAAYAAPEVKEAMVKQGNDINIGTPEAAAKFFRDETERYARLINRIGLKID